MAKKRHPITTGYHPTSESQLAADKMVAQHSLPPLPVPAWRVYCRSARAECDELVGAMRAQLLQQQRFEAKLVVGGLVKLVDEADLDAAWILVVAPSTVIHARYLCVKLRAQLPNLKIAIGLWGATENITHAAQRLRDSGANEVVTTLADAVVQLAKLTPASDVEMTPEPIPPTNTVGSSASRS